MLIRATNIATKFYNKLVRDKMRDVIASDGNTANMKIINGPELERAIRAKVLEEAGEFAASGSIEELADLLEIVRRASAGFGPTGWADTVAVAQAKYLERGGFDRGVFLVSVTGENLP